MCPRCGWHDLHPVQVRNALSRKDGKTYICSSCGLNEAMLNIRFGRDADVWPDYPDTMKAH